MVLGIDASNIRAGGGLLHLKQLLNNVETKKYNIKKIVIWSCQNTLDEIEEKPFLKKCHAPVLEQNYFRRFLWQKKSLKKNLLSEDCDILFVPGGSFSTNFRPVVTMSQNLSPFELNEIFRYGISLSTIRLILLRIYQTNSFNKADGTIFLTNYAKEKILKIANRMKGTTAVIPHGINNFFYNKPRLKNNLTKNYPSKPFRILYVSNIEPYKNHHQVIDAVNNLFCKGFSVNLKLIGSGSPKRIISLKKKIKQIDPLGKFIQYLGFVPHENLPIQYFNSDAFLFASSCENMPVTLMEGMASGIPIVCSDCNPMPEILIEAGTYFNPKSVDSIENALKELLTSPEMRVKKAKKAFEQAKQYSWKKCSLETFSFLSQILENYNQKDYSY